MKRTNIHNRPSLTTFTYTIVTTFTIIFTLHSISLYSDL